MSKYSENIPASIIGAIGWFYDEIPEGAKVLDVGCSTGYYGAYIKKNKKCSVYGVEVSQDKVQARKVLDGVYSFDLDGEWPEEVYENSYDVVFIGDVIEHLKDPGLALSKVLKLLSEEGKVYVSTPNVAHQSVRLELLGGNFEYEQMGILDNTHLKYFTLNSLTRIVDGAGYCIERLDSSESDYPKEVTQSLLDSYGLKASKKFWDMMATPEARAFQYKLVLSRKKSNVKSAVVPDMPRKPEQYKADFISNLQTQVSDYVSEIENLRKVRVDLNSEVAKLGTTLENVLSSKAYKTAVLMQKTKSNATKLIRKSGSK